jgi:hypothetical protein
MQLTLGNTVVLAKGIWSSMVFLQCMRSTLVNAGELVLVHVNSYVHSLLFSNVHIINFGKRQWGRDGGYFQDFFFKALGSDVNVEIL